MILLFATLQDCLLTLTWYSVMRSHGMIYDVLNVKVLRNNRFFRKTGLPQGTARAPHLQLSSEFTKKLFLFIITDKARSKGEGSQKVSVS